MFALSIYFFVSFWMFFVIKIIIRFLDFHVKAMLTAGADNGMLPLLPGQSKIVLAGRTSFINVGFLVTLFTLLKINKSFWLFNKLDEFLVFLLSFVNIFDKTR